MVHQTANKILWLLWILIVPFGLWLTYRYFPPYFEEVNVHIIGFIILMLIAALMPLQINHRSIFLIQWVSLAVFFIFGIFIEMVLTQIAIIMMLLRVRIKKEDSFRFPLNSIMYFFISLLSGCFYYSFGGEHDTSLNPTSPSFWLFIAYPVVHYVLQEACFIFISISLYQRKEFFGKDFLWESITSLITIPIGFVLYILYKHVGVISIFFVGLSFASLLIILRLYFRSEEVNENIKKAVEIGHELAVNLKVQDVIDVFKVKLRDMLKIDYLFIFEVTDDNKLTLLSRVEHGESIEMEPSCNESLDQIVWSDTKAVMFHSKKDRSPNANDYLPERAESVLSVPITYHKKIVGVLILASDEKKAFQWLQLNIVDILCSHFAIALENAKNFERAKRLSERCELTKLYNFRYMDSLLDKEFLKLQRKQRSKLSFIILDIDHFKKINDTYGHQSGNEVLFHLAERLTRLIQNKGTIARYGGEEFVILLPDVHKQEAMAIAESVRLAIANKPFILEEHFEHELNRKLQIHVTVSIGVSTAPDDGDDAISLIRHADRALYFGAKQAGRNRVGNFGEVVGEKF
ncbi:diguanylate cyclase [Bacillus sp. 03113]|uniref:diguanylate cyclase n=1 Tax=Bacillus sp. 03113 TaxID=2578211 RepID=UPI001141368C|nr:diguanylate cyclase [Bacillus sp. 03113]